MPRLSFLTATVLMSFGLLPGACYAQRSFPYGASLPARSSAGNVPPSPSVVGTGVVVTPDSRTFAPSMDNSLPGQPTMQPSTATQPSRVTNPMLQNMSNPSNLSHVGMTIGQQTAQNLYFGRQFDDWSNLRHPSSMPYSFGELSRTQPQPFGGYIAPNNYVGSGFSNWSNLSQGTVTANPLGGWNYSTR